MTPLHGLTSGWPFALILLTALVFVVYMAVER